MERMGSARRYPPELRDRAVRMVYEWREARGRNDGGLKEVGQKLGVHAESIRNWLRQAEIDGGKRDGLTTEERQRMRQLERENFELRRANEILKSAAAFFGAELDRRPKR
jgi:transposase